MLQIENIAESAESLFVLGLRQLVTERTQTGCVDYGHSCMPFSLRKILVTDVIDKATEFAEIFKPS